jgi:hypothetical protein
MKNTLVTCGLLLLLAIACGGGEATSDKAGTNQVRGQIVEVVARNITEVETLRIRNNSGRELTFSTEGFAGFTPSHLKEHQLFGQSVLVFYVVKGDQLIAVNITD